MRVLGAIVLAVCAATAIAQLACGGGGSSQGGPPTAAIVVPNAGSTVVPPGGALSFEGRCEGVAPFTHAWTFAGGSQATSDSEVPGVVSFAAAGSHAVTYQCTDAKGTVSNQAALTVTGTSSPLSQFAIKLQFLNGADAYQADFQAAADRVSQMVLGPVPGYLADEPASSDCGNTAFSTDVGYLLVLADTEPITSPPGALALSGPCYVRTSDGLPFAGIVRINSDYIPTLQSNGTLQAVITHEMLHVLGYGSLWGPVSAHGFGLLVGAGGSDPHFSGDQAVAAFRDFDGGAAYAGTPVPVENTGGDASRDRHWRKTVFGAELMTASLTPGVAPVLSRTTLESLADLGYQVDVGAADPFSVDPLAMAAVRLEGRASAEELDLGGDILPVTPRAEPGVR